MSSLTRKHTIATRVQLLPKSELFIHFITALRNECFLYASILHQEIQGRKFTSCEVDALRNSSFYPLLNGVLDTK